MKAQSILAWMCFFAIPAAAADSPWFKIRAVDSETGRGVPLVELKTVNETAFVTDGNGIAAFNEPGLMDREVFFHVSSHGYEYPADGFGYRGVRLWPEAGGEAKIELKRVNLAERLYRLTGQGIYRDSLLTGEPVHLQQPAMNGGVMGQDSVLAAVYRGKLHWFWGDTSRAAYPLGNFRTAGAAAPLPGEGGTDPERGVDYEYFVNENGFCKEMCSFKKSNLVWLDGLLTVEDAEGRERMIAHYSHRASLERELEHGLAVFDDARQEFGHLITFDSNHSWQCPRAHPIRAEVDGKEYFYFPSPFPTVRAPATLEALMDLSNYESYTLVETGNPDGPAHQYRWVRGAPPMDPRKEARAIEEGRLSAEDARFLPLDVDTGKRVTMHSGSVRWNPYRNKWISIAVEIGGTSFLGEVWYSEADALTGPWRRAKKIVTHNRYSFYNPVHHAFFDSPDGRVIYFEGTYSRTFSGAEAATPRYDYNQILYRLDLGSFDLD